MRWCKRQIAAAATFAFAATAAAGPIYTGPAVTGYLGQPLSFNLIAAGELGEFADLPTDPNAYVLQVISTVWTFHPPGSSSGFLDLAGTLQIAGQESGLYLNQTIDLSDVTGAVYFSKNDGGNTGLPISHQLAEQLLANAGTVSGMLIPTPETESNWGEFFEMGGKLRNYVFFEITFRDTTSTGVVPEPSTICAWAVAAAFGAAAHRWRKRRNCGQA
jgi:hypothetical protein